MIRKPASTLPLLLAFLFFPAFSLFSQAPRVKSGIPDSRVLPLQEIPLMAILNLQEAPDDFGAVLKNSRVIHEPGTNLIKEEVARLKEEANRLKSENKSASSAFKSSDSRITDPPVIGENFFGNTFDGGIPNDNDLSISQGGKIISVTNSRIHCYDSTGLQLSAKSLGAFVSGAPGVGTNTKYDPKTLYDPVNDRYIVVFLNGSSSSTSKVVVAFSKTNNPAGLYNIYGLNGNLDGSSWSDFVQIGISQTELFITTNLFSNQGVPNGAGVWQIELSDGYAGTSLTTQTYVANFFSMHPVSGGMTAYGPHFYFVQSDVGPASSDVYIHKITNTIAGGGTLQSPVTIALDNSYTIPPDADQAGTATGLSTGDTRIQSAYFENNRIQFVMNTGFQNKACVYYGTIVLSGLGLSFSQGIGTYIAYSDIEVAFPAIAYGGSQGGDGTNTSYVSFCYASSTQYAGSAAAFVDGDGAISGYSILKTGSSAVTGAGGRWGDYSGIQERPGNPGEAWVGGSYATNLGYTQTYITQLLPPGPLAISPAMQNLAADMQVFPVPATGNVNFTFEVRKEGNYELAILDVNGKEIAVPVNEYLRRGTARTAFSTAPLASGTYFAVVRNEAGNLLSEKFIVSK